MPRPRLITAIAAMQTAYTLLMAGLTVMCVFLWRSALRKPNAAGEVYGLMVGALVLGILAVLFAVCATGLWRFRRWGWVFSLALNALVVFLILWDVFIDRDYDPDSWTGLALFGIPMVLLLLPAVRRPFFPKNKAAAA
jgi:hypothetical protein